MCPTPMRVLLALPVLIASLTVMPLRAEAPVDTSPSAWRNAEDLIHPEALANQGVVTAPPGANIQLGATVEPTIAVDPNNALRVAAASLFSLRVSTDGGLTFQPTVAAVVPATHGLCGDPSVGYDSQGRLFWAYLGCSGTNGIDIFIARVNPTTGAIMAGYPVNVTAQIGMPAPANSHDKEWLAVDHYAGSPYQDNLYLAWTDLTSGSVIRSTTSSDQGLNWSAPVTLSGAGEGFVWPTHNTVGPNGDVYVTYHAPASNGAAGQVYMLRSTDGGASFPQKNNPYTAGQADVTFNVQSGAGTIPNTQFWLQGNGQAYVLADPNVPGRIYVIASDDPDNDHTTGDASNIYIATSTNFGVNFGAPVRIDDGPGTTFQVMPSAGIDVNTGCIVVTWYDNRSGATNAGGDFLLDVYARASDDGGVTWGTSIKLNDVPFDPVAGARCRFGPVNCGTVDTVNTLRIGEYNGVATANGVGFAVWGGNTLDAMGNAVAQQTIFDRFAFDTEKPSMTCPMDITLECSQHGGVPATDPAIVAFLNVTATDNCDPNVPVTNDAPALFPPGTTTVTFSATDDAGNTETCMADVEITDTIAPTITYCPPDTTVECSSHCGVPKSELLAWLSQFMATDICDANPTLGNDAPDCFPMGATLVTFTATDAAGLMSTCTATLTVEDTTPPTIDVVLDRDVLWPPNHKLAEVCADVTVEDICDPNPTWVLFSTASDEPDDDRGDGNTVDDIQGDAVGTEDACLQLRSERQGGNDGRKYTLIYQAMDSSGNTAYDTVCVLVPHDQSAGALASTGFSADGKTISGLTDKFVVIIPSTDLFDVQLLDKSRIYLGNTAGVAKTAETRLVDINNDGRLDLALFYSVEVAFGTTPASVNVNDVDSRKRERTDGPVGIHFVTPAGQNFLVSNIYALGAPVAMPAVTLDIPPSLFDVPDESTVPELKQTALSSVYPNPFNPQTTMSYTLASQTRVRVAIYDVRGALVRLLVDDAQPAGSHQAVWNGTDDSGRPMGSGIYFVRMTAGSYQETRKVVMLK